MIPGARPIPRIHAPSVAAFRREYEHARRPVVITGALDNRPALASWSLDHLAMYGDKPVQVRISRRGEPQLFNGNPGAAFAFRTVPLREAAEQATRSDAEVWYVQHCDLREMPRLAREIGPLRYAPRLLQSRSKLWICGPGTINPLHWDTHHAALAQIRGEKRFVLFPPGDSRWIASLEHRVLWRTSGLDLSAVDRTRFPYADRASAWSCTVRPGEILFMPYAWWHYMECDEPAISVTWWWPPSLAHHARDSVREIASGWMKRGLRALRSRGNRSPGPTPESSRYLHED